MKNSLFAAQENFLDHFSDERKPLSLRFCASEVTLSGLAGGEYFPLPASKGPAFPFLLTLDGYPTSPANYAQGQRFFSINPRNSKTKNLNSRSELVFPFIQRSLKGICPRSIA